MENVFVYSVGILAFSMPNVIELTFSEHVWPRKLNLA